MSEDKTIWIADRERGILRRVYDEDEFFSGGFEQEENAVFVGRANALDYLHKRE